MVKERSEDRNGQPQPITRLRLTEKILPSLGGFRVGRRAYPTKPEILEEGDRILISASHDGYQWLPGKNHHYRSWSFALSSVLIEDCITGDFREAVAYFQMHPNVQLEPSRMRQVVSYATARSVSC